MAMYWILLAAYLVVYAIFASYSIRFLYRDRLYQPLAFDRVWLFLVVATAGLSVALVAIGFWKQGILRSAAALVALCLLFSWPVSRARRTVAAEKEAMSRFYAAITGADSLLIGANRPGSDGPVFKWCLQLREKDRRALAYAVAQKSLEGEAVASAFLKTVFERSDGKPQVLFTPEELR